MQRCQPRPEMIITRFTCESCAPSRSATSASAPARAPGPQAWNCSSHREARTAARWPGPPPGGYPDRQPLRAAPAPRTPATARRAAACAAGRLDRWVHLGHRVRQVRAASAPRASHPSGPGWRYPLVPDQELTPTGTRARHRRQRQRRLLGTRPEPLAFHQPELTVHLHREAAGEWIAWMPRPPSRRRGGLAPPCSPTRRPTGRRCSVPAHSPPGRHHQPDTLSASWGGPRATRGALGTEICLCAGPVPTRTSTESCLAC